MLTIRQVDKLWQLKAYERLLDELCIGRAEATGGIRQLIHGSVAAAALVVIRMDELHQGHLPQVANAIRYVLSQQAPTGGWGDAVTSALCLRALSRGAGTGVAVDQAVKFLSNLQKEDGEWPREPMNRFPGDPAVTAFVLLQLAESRTPAARALVARTLDRLSDESIGTDGAATTAGDHQLATLRDRARTRHAHDNALYHDLRGAPMQQGWRPPLAPAVPESLFVVPPHACLDGRNPPAPAMHRLGLEQFPSPPVPQVSTQSQLARAG